MSSTGPIDGRVRLTAAALFLHMDDKGLTFVGQQLLAMRTGAGERSIRRHITSMVSDGWLTIRRIKIAGVGHVAWRNEYKAVIPRRAVAANKVPLLSNEVAANVAPPLSHQVPAKSKEVPAKLREVAANSWPRNSSSEHTNITSSDFSIENRRRQKREFDPKEQARKLSKHLRTDPAASDEALAAMYKVSVGDVHQLRRLVQAEAAP